MTSSLYPISNARVHWSVKGYGDNLGIQGMGNGVGWKCISDPKSAGNESKTSIGGQQDEMEKEAAMTADKGIRSRGCGCLWEVWKGSGGPARSGNRLSQRGGKRSDVAK